jgi:hypothetical protein
MYPFELEWLEGEMLIHAIRLLEGKSMYAAPSTEFISEVYPPFYYITIAGLCKIFGVSFFVPRLISVVSCFGILFFLYRIPVKEGGLRSIGLVSCGFFVSCYPVHAAWYDVGRVDMLFYVLLIASCYVLAYYRNTSWALASSVILYVLACYTKQSVLVFFPFIALYLFSVDKRQAIIFVCSVSVLLLIIFYVLNTLTEGWFSTYTLLNPLRYAFKSEDSSLITHYDFLADVKEKLVYEMRYEIFYKLPLFFTLVIAFLIKRVVSLKRPFNLTVWEYTAVPAAVAYFMLRPHLGSERNDLIYMTLWGSILLGFLLMKLSVSRATGPRSSTMTTIYFLLVLQLVLLLYNPKEQVPSSQSVSKGFEFISMVNNMPGEVYIPYHAMYAIMAGKKMVINAGAFWGYQVTAEKEWVPTDLIEKINNKYFSAIIIDDKSYYSFLGQTMVLDNVKMLLSHGEYLSEAINENYKLAGRISYESDDEFRNPVAFRTRPELILVPRNS